MSAPVNLCASVNTARVTILYQQRQCGGSFVSDILIRLHYFLISHLLSTIKVAMWSLGRNLATDQELCSVQGSKMKTVSPNTILAAALKRI